MIKNVWAAYFTGTDTTKNMTEYLAKAAGEALGLQVKVFDFTLPQARQEVKIFSKEDLVFLGTPVIAGRVPNVLLKYLGTIRGEGALGVPVVLYGNRNYDNALIELRDIMEDDGFKTIGAGAFIGEHSFSKILGAHRPDSHDFEIAKEFAEAVCHKVKNLRDSAALEPVFVKGKTREESYGGYYQPRDRQGTPVNILKVKPKTKDNCIDCKLCAKVCPMGSINFDNVSEITGICMKCCACVKKCPVQAKYYDDANYLYHQNELEEGYVRRAEPETFL